MYFASIKISLLSRHLLMISYLVSMLGFFANKLSLSIEKISFVIFHLAERKITYNLHLTLSGKELKQESFIKYLVVFIDSNLSWKHRISDIGTEIKRRVGILSNSLLAFITLPA